MSFPFCSCTSPPPPLLFSSILSFPCPSLPPSLLPTFPFSSPHPTTRILSLCRRHRFLPRFLVPRPETKSTMRCCCIREKNIKKKGGHQCRYRCGQGQLPDEKLPRNGGQIPAFREAAAERSRLPLLRWRGRLPVPSRLGFPRRERTRDDPEHGLGLLQEVREIYSNFLFRHGGCTIAVLFCLPVQGEGQMDVWVG